MEGFNPPVTPSKIVQDNWRFSIPIYQRLFVWESEQIDRLLDDLWMASQNKDQSPYYVGVITAVEQSYGKNGRVFSVVDGQQRLTFLLLFFRECIKIENAKKFVFIGQKQAKSQLRIRFIGRTDDEKDICHYGDNEYGSITNLNFRQFHDRMEIFIKKHNNDWERNKETFIQYVFDKTSFLVNELVGFSNVDLNLYFEKMNSTGRQLSPLEQLKGEFASYASDWNDCFNFETTRCESEAKRNPVSEKADSDTHAIDHNSPSVDGKDINLDAIVNYKEKVEDEPRRGQEAITFSRLPMRPEVLALHALRLTLRALRLTSHALRLTLREDDINLSPHHLLKTFNKVMREAIHNDPDIRKMYIENLKMYRDWLDKNIIYLRGEMEADSDEGSDASGLKYDFRKPLESFDAANDRKVLQLQLQSMLYVSSGESQEWILKAYNDCEGGEVDFNSLRQYALKRLDKDGASKLTYSPGMNRLAFWILDYLLWEKVYKVEPRQERVSISFCDGVAQELSKDQIAAIKRYRFTQNRSVEHLHPQNPPTESDAWNADRKNSDKVRNCFGNLCMISQSANSSLSNEPVNVKFEKVKNALQRHSLQSIKLMLMFANCKGEDHNWTPEKAIKHGRDMLKVLGFNDNSIMNWEKDLAFNGAKAD